MVGNKRKQKTMVGLHTGDTKYTNYGSIGYAARHNGGGAGVIPAALRRRARAGSRAGPISGRRRPAAPRRSGRTRRPTPTLH